MTDTIIDHSKYIHIQDSHLILSWKVWITFVIVRISCVESWLSNSYISLTAIQLGLFSSWLKQFMVTWVQPWHQGSLSILYIFVHFSHMLRVHSFHFWEMPAYSVLWYDQDLILCVCWMSAFEILMIWRGRLKLDVFPLNSPWIE